MASLTNTKIKDTYDGLLKTTDNDALGGTYKLITDGLGNSSGLYLGTGGRLGINQSSPLSKLHITNDSGGSGGYLKVTDAVYSGDVRFGMADGVDNDAVLGVWTNNNVKIYTNSTERMRIDSSGRVGIGTSSPSSLMHISKSTSPAISNSDLQGIKLTNTSTSFGGSGIGIELDAGNGDVNAMIAVRADGNDNTTEALFIATTTSDPIIFATNSGGTDITTNERMRIDSSGNVLVGTNTVLAGAANRGNITINGTSSAILSFGKAGALQGYLYHDGSQMLLNTGTAPAVFEVNGSERMRIDSSGNVGIGTTSPDISGFSKALTIDGSDVGVELSNSGVITAIFSGNTQGASISGVGSSGIRFRTSASGGTTERMRITSGGDVLVGTTSKGYGLFTSSRLTIGDGDTGDGVCIGGLIQNNSAYTVQADNNTGTRYFAYIANGSSSVVGTISFTSTATAYNTSSDYRLKENVVDMTGALDRVDQLEPKRFNFIADEDTTVDGFLAHEVQDIVPEAVTGEKDAVDDEGNPEYQGIDQSKIVPLLVGAIKELKTEIETLKSQINS